jgi:hypothetical protein
MSTRIWLPFDLHTSSLFWGLLSHTRFCPSTPPVLLHRNSHRAHQACIHCISKHWNQTGAAGCSIADYEHFCGTTPGDGAFEISGVPNPNYRSRSTPPFQGMLWQRVGVCGRGLRFASHLCLVQLRFTPCSGSTRATIWATCTLPGHP